MKIDVMDNKHRGGWAAAQGVFPRAHVAKHTELQVTITEGKKNEVRIVLAAVGLPVSKLHRISYGPVKLGNLSVGEIIELPQKTVDLMIKSF